VVQVDFLSLIDKDPHADVKLSFFKEEWPFNVFLDNPARIFLTGGYEFYDVSELIKNFDASPLVGCCWFHQPNVISTVFHWCPFFRTIAFSDIFISLYELLCL
jgi:hypothetical protein